MSGRHGVRLAWVTVAAVLTLWLRPFAVAPSGAGAPQAAGPPAVQVTDAARRDRFERAYRASNLGVARLEQFDYAAAADAFREALRIEPSLAAARLNLALALFYDGHLDTAEAEARAAAAAMPDAPQPPFLLGLIAKAQNRTDDAIAAFRRTLAIDAADPGANVYLAQVYLQQRDTTQAIALFRAALAAEPVNVTAAYGLATALVRGGGGPEGQAAMQRFQALRDAPYGLTYAQGYLQQGRYAEAVVSTGGELELVDAATPAVAFTDATPDAFRGVAARDITLFDCDGDGDLDLLLTTATTPRLFRNDEGRFVDVTAASGLDAPIAGLSRAVAGDYDNDGRPDLLLVAGAGYRLLHQTASGRFEDVTASATLPAATKDARSAAFVDVDHDGDLDIVVAGVTAPTQLLRNNGNGTFTDIGAAAGLAGAPAGGIAIVPTDFDNHRDIDVMIVPGGGAAPALFQNKRDGTFQDVAQPVGLPGRGAYSAVAAGDVNKDGFTDFFFGRTGDAGVFAISDGRGRFAAQPAPDGTRAATAAQFIDYDNDGLLDLLVAGANGPALYRSRGRDWVDVSGPAGLTALKPATGRVTQIAAGDLDGDRDTDAIALFEDGTVHLWRNDGGSRQRALRVLLAARGSNRSGFGAKVEMRAGGLRQKLELSSATPAVAPADLLFGLGPRPAADIVRVLWPSGILQTELAGGEGATPPTSLTMAELDRKPSSCPYLFTWNGTRFEFITDFMGGGEMGDWVGPAAWNQPDPDEYVRIRGDQLVPRDGRYELRVTNELEEALFLDRVQLVAVDHPAGVDVYPDEGLRATPPAFKIYRTRGARPPLRATDDGGRDVLDRVRALDRRYVDGFQVSPIRGYASSHTLTLDLGPGGDHTVVLLTGWTDYAFSTDNVAAVQSGLTMQPPIVQVRDAAGSWQTVIADMGFPVGRPQTIVVDLAGRFRAGVDVPRQVRIVTNMRIYWDQVQVAEAIGGTAPRVTRLDPSSAELHARGFSAEASPDGREPYVYDYSRVSTNAPWKIPAGRYTRYGDVLPLVRGGDDMYAIAAPGDEVALTFAASTLPPSPRGWTRTFFLYADGYSKEMNIRSATPDAVAPLPFHAMRGYPYGAGEHYPDTVRHRAYLSRYNTRVVAAPVPSLERSAAAAAATRRPR